MELALPGATSKGHAELPWAKPQVLMPEDFSSKRIEQYVEAIARCVVDGAYTHVMAPAHYLMEVSNDWLEIDAELTRALRAQLDALHQEAVRITYPLAVHHSVFYDAGARAILRRELRALSIDAISLRIHPFGSGAGPLVMRSFIEACWDLQQIGVPLMIERSGIAGISAYALGAVDVIESGITMGDSFDVGALQRPLQKSNRPSFSPPQRVFVEAFAATVERELAAKLMSSPRGKLHFACKDRACCPNGYQDMLEDPERHSALARQRQYAELSRVPPTMRTEYFIHNIFTPVCDMLARASDSHEPFKKAHRRMLSLKTTLLDLQHQQRQLRDRLVPPGPAVPPRTAAQVIRLPLTPRGPRGR
jgi:hypothetical protein